MEALSGVLKTELLVQLAALAELMSWEAGLTEKLWGGILIYECCYWFLWNIDQSHGFIPLPTLKNNNREYIHISADDH